METAGRFLLHNNMEMFHFMIFIFLTREFYYTPFSDLYLFLCICKLRSSYLTL